MKKIMILGASILQVPALKKAKEMGLYVIAVDMNPEAVGFPLADEQLVISTTDIEAVLVAAKERKIDAIMTLASDMPMRTVAKVSQEMNLVGLTEDTAFKATNKACMRQALKKGNVPIPMFFSVEDFPSFEQAVSKIRSQGYKCIIKPVDSSGSRGVDLLDAYDSPYLISAYNYCRNQSRSGVVMVEEYMEGPEVSVETITVNGISHVLQITDKLTTGDPYFVEMGHSQPSQLSEKTQKQIKSITIAAINAIGIWDGPSHTEVKVTQAGPKIVEIGARLGGDNITGKLVPLSTGIDMVEASIKIALGEVADLKQKTSQGSAIRYFSIRPGIIQSVEGYAEATEIAGVDSIFISYNIGDEVKEVHSSTDRVGFVVATGATASDAVDVCLAALDKVKIITK